MGGFGGGGSPYEPGINGLAPGQAAGGNGDIITPFNARDPASLILSPDAAAQPPVGSSNAPSSDNSGQDNGQAPWKNVLAQAGGNAANAAGQSAGLPTAPPALGDGVFADHGPANSTSASYTPPPISASNVPNKAAGNDSLSQVHGSGVSGASPYGLTNAGSAEGLKGAANQAGAYFNRPTSAAGNLEKAASVNMPTGGSGSAGSGAGGSQKDKGFGQDSNKDSKSAGESLAQKAAEENQQHAIELYWKKLEEQQMAPIKLREDINKDIVETPIKAIMDAIGKQLAKEVGNAWNGAGTRYWCEAPSDSRIAALAAGFNLKFGPQGSVFYSCDDTSDANPYFCVDSNGGLTDHTSSQSNSKSGDSSTSNVVANCHAEAAKDLPNDPNDTNGAGNGPAVETIGSNAAGGIDLASKSIAKTLNNLCTWATDEEGNSKDGGAGGQTADSSDAPNPKLVDISQARKIYVGGGSPSGPAHDIAEHVYALSKNAVAACGVNAAGQDSAVDELGSAVKAMKNVPNELTTTLSGENDVLTIISTALCGGVQPCQLKVTADAAVKTQTQAEAEQIKTYWKPRNGWPSDKD
ncbi:MAG: hypothetical protein KGL04_09170, partial [Elusimicrobia bacterium]|nr:hypothetical protein [Elusimicrobiota bacterium]